MAGRPPPINLSLTSPRIPEPVFKSPEDSDLQTGSDLFHAAASRVKRHLCKSSFRRDPTILDGAARLHRSVSQRFSNLRKRTVGERQLPSSFRFHSASTACRPPTEAAPVNPYSIASPAPASYHIATPEPSIDPDMVGPFRLALRNIPNGDDCAAFTPLPPQATILRDRHLLLQKLRERPESIALEPSHVASDSTLDLTPEKNSTCQLMTQFSASGYAATNTPSGYCPEEWFAQDKRKLPRSRLSSVTPAARTPSPADSVVITETTLEMTPTEPPVMAAGFFRCTVYGTNGSDYVDAIEDCRDLVVEAGGRIVEEAGFLGGFCYDMTASHLENPLDDGEPTLRGGHIRVSPLSPEDARVAVSVTPPRRRRVTVVPEQRPGYGSDDDEWRPVVPLLRAGDFRCLRISCGDGDSLWDGEDPVIEEARFATPLKPKIVDCQQRNGDDG